MERSYSQQTRPLSGGNLIRDIYDLAWAARHESPDLMMPAIRTFRPAEFKTMIDVLGDIRAHHLPINRDRPIVEPAEPLFEVEALDILGRHLRELRPPRAQRSGSIQR